VAALVTALQANLLFFYRINKYLILYLLLLKVFKLLYTN
jgi:hypothetical protein